MASTPPLPVIEFYTRTGCHICNEARAVLQQILEERARRGDPIGRVRYVDLAKRPDLEPEYGPWLPVIEIGDSELKLSSTYRPISRFLDMTLGRTG
jgi:Glutaredoxin-like domain (DUF836)